MTTTPLDIAPQDVKQRLAAGEGLTIIDVRRPDEVEAWPFPGSVHIPLADLMAGAALPSGAERDVVTLCSHGNRSRTAAQLLRRRGIEARSLSGGMAGWSQTYDVVTIPLGSVEVAQFRRLGKGCLSYLVTSGGESAVIDPSWHVEQYVETAAGQGAAVRHVFDTHLHADHVSGAPTLASAAGAPLHINPVDGFQFTGFEAVQDGDAIRVGSATLTAIAAPGHTKGSIVWDIDGKALATGDILFLESVGRPDLHGQADVFARDLFRSLGRLLALPDDRLVLPGHMPEGAALALGEPHMATLGEIRARLRLERDEAAFVARAAQVPPRPPNDLLILEVNRRGRPIDPDAAAHLEEGPNRCAVKST
jgi:glyoxylase-like metal-dependent hydrolase (beta-lactamase superfamily II)/rhodanese-related sulfurtransferase